MRQYEAVEIIANQIKKTNLVEAIYLKGSLARGTEDEYSNIDLYLLVLVDNLDKINNTYLDLFKKYDELIYYKQNIDSSIIIFENGIYINLYIHTLKELNMTDDMVIIYDSNNLLSNYIKIPLKHKPKELGEILDDFLISSIKFYNSYNREDLFESYIQATNLFKGLGIIIRYKYQPDFSKLGLKWFDLKNSDIDKYLDIAKKLHIDSRLECVKMIYIFLDSYIANLPILLAEHINFDFYAYTKRLIMSLNL